MRINEIETLMFQRTQNLKSELKLLTDAKPMFLTLKMQAMILEALINELETWRKLIKKSTFDETINSDFILNKREDNK